MALDVSSNVTAFLRYVDTRRRGEVCAEWRRVVSLMGETKEMGM
tara:strand:+ start:3472 stop:3603 length:132 start_codon:yes stop_codon:yes gene_type:complete